MNSNAKIKSDDKIKEIANELGISEKQVREIVETHFELAKGIIEESNMEAVRIPYLGVFKPNMFLVERKGLNGTSDSK